MSDVDEFLGIETDAPTEKRGQKKKNRGGGGTHRTASDSTVIMALNRPVSVTFLMQVWGMDRKTILKRLSELPPVGQHRGNQPLYDFRQAAQYLVTPRVNVAQHIKKMGVEDLPKALQKDVWDAKLKEQKWRLQAGELWPTEDVLEVLGEAFHRLKTTTQLWIDQLSEGHALPAEAREELTRMVDALQADLHHTLVEMPKERATPSQIGEIAGTDLDG